MVRKVASGREKIAGPRRSYDWSKHCDGSEYIASQGEDYDDYLRFRSAAYAYANNKGLRVVVEEQPCGTKARFRFFPRGESR